MHLGSHNLIEAVEGVRFPPPLNQGRENLHITCANAHRIDGKERAAHQWKASAQVFEGTGICRRTE